MSVPSRTCAVLVLEVVLGAVDALLCARQLNRSRRERAVVHLPELIRKVYAASSFRRAFGAHAVAAGAPLSALCGPGAGACHAPQRRGGTGTGTASRAASAQISMVSGKSDTFPTSANVCCAVGRVAAIFLLPSLWPLFLGGFSLNGACVSGASLSWWACGGAGRAWQETRGQGGMPDKPSAATRFGTRDARGVGRLTVRHGRW